MIEGRRSRKEVAGETVAVIDDLCPGEPKVIDGVKIEQQKEIQKLPSDCVPLWMH